MQFVSYILTEFRDFAFFVGKNRDFLGFCPLDAVFECSTSMRGDKVLKLSLTHFFMKNLLLSIELSEVILIFGSGK